MTVSLKSDHPNTKEMLSIVRNGLPENGLSRKKVTIIGAGMAGIVAASLLKRAGHTVKLLEKSNRLGGRILTERNAFTHGLYLEMGAMRIPSTHLLVLEYIKKYKIPIQEFINSTPNDPIYINGVRTRLKDYQQNPDILRYPVPPEEKGKTSEELFKYAIDPFMKWLDGAAPKEKEKILMKFDRYSFENFLLYNPFNHSLSPEAVDMIGAFAGISGFPELSFLQLLFDVYQVITNPGVKFHEITGGLDQLPYAFFPEIKEIVHFNESVTDIVPAEKSVQVFTGKGQLKRKYSSDVLIITVPFPALSFINIHPDNYFSYKKRMAINKLHYTTSTKIGLEFTHRFWEKEGIFGGQLITDAPISNGHYPSYHLGSKGHAVMLASYTWEDDTLPWDCLPEGERIEKALENLALVHGPKIYDHFVTGASKSWSHDTCIGGGDFSMFKPNQRTLLKPAIAQPEGRVHFAGEHTSDQMAWIEGAVESGIRVAKEVHERL